MIPSSSAYFSYLLRLWLAGDDDQPEWRLALVDTQTGETFGFTCLEALKIFLQARMEETKSLETGSQPTHPSSMRITDS